MTAIAGQKSGLTWAVHISVVLLVGLWLFPTLGLFISSFRTADQIASSGRSGQEEFTSGSPVGGSGAPLHGSDCNGTRPVCGSHPSLYAMVKS